MMKKFSKIGKLSTAAKALQMKHQFQGLDEDGNPIYDKLAKMPVENLWGTVKLHGTNAGVMQYPDGTLQFQSRENVITPEKDNAGFAFWANSKQNELTKLINFYRVEHEIYDSHSVVVYGEWAGKGVQKNVAVSELPKAFYVFAICVITKDLDDKDSNYYLPMHKSFHWVDKENNIFNLWDKTCFPVYEIKMDLENPALIQNEIVEITQEVEKKCPVGEYFGVEGIGEGVVWMNEDRSFLCKIKGDKHAGKSKVRKTNTVDIAKMNSVNEFVSEFVDEERLEQAWQKMIELDFGHEPKFTGNFVRWMINDIISEESDTLQASGLEPKDVNPAIGKASSRWFISRLDQIE